MAINISDNDPRVSYTATSGQTVFTVSFEFFEEADLTVYINGTEKTITTDYTVTGGDGSTGTVTLTSGATLGDKIVIVRDVSLQRTSDFTAGAAISREALNEQLDIITAQIADVDDKASRALQISDHDTAFGLNIPSVDDRKGKLLGFNLSTGASEVGPTIADAQSLADVSADIATLADIEDGTDATDAIQTAASISSDISTVSGISANVTTVAGISSDVTAVANDASDIGTVAGDSSDIQALGPISADIQTLADIEDGTDATGAIQSVASISANVTTVAGISGNVTTVAGIASDVTAVAGDAADIGTVASGITDVQSLGPISADITTVAGISSNVTTVAGDSTDIQTLGDISADISTAAGISANITTVAGISSDVTTVAGDSADIQSIADNLTDIGTVADSISDVNAFATRYRVGATDPTVSLDEGDLFFNTTSNDLKYYNGSAWKDYAGDAAASATTATTKASEASTSASNASASESAAAAAQTAAESARDSALAAFDNFDDVYLGSKTADPTVDNDGDALVGGALYYNSVDEVMKLYTGSSWVAAYASLSGALLVASNLSDLQSASSARTNLGVAIGTDVQAYDAQLDDISGLTPTDGNFIVGDGTNFVTESGSTARTSLGLGTAATHDVGTSAGNVVELDGSGKLPAVDGSQLTGIEGVPSGVIAMWSGTNANIPSGWALCDGTNGTPNLTDRFILGRAAASNTNSTGGSNTVTLAEGNLPSHTHSFSANATTGAGGAHTPAGNLSNSGNHSHSADGNLAAASAGAHTHNLSGNTGAGGDHNHNGNTSNAGSHSHNFEIHKVTFNVTLDRVPGMLKNNSSPATSNYGTANAGAHSHNLSLGNSGNHTHTLSGTAASAGAHTHDITGNTSASGAHTHNFTGTAVGNHTHSVSVSGTTGSTGSGTALTVTPKYYTLAYIMKT